MTEIYKDIKGYEGIYQISNLGNVKRIDKKNQKGNESKKTKKIIDTKTGEIYPSTLTLSIKLGIKRNTLKSWLSNNRTNKTNYRYL